MIAIKSIINTFNAKEQQQFIAYLRHKNKRTDTKNIQLFKLLAQGKTDAELICKTLYGSDNRNAYHALRKRLIDSLIDFTANKNLEDENSIDIQIIKYILASRTFLLQKNYTTAYKLLDRAEQLADAHGLFPILNEIYHTKIQYAPDYQKADLDKLIKKQENNRVKHLLEDQLNSLYAKLKTALNTINDKETSLNFEAILSDALKNTSIILDESLSFKSLYQILAIANISAFVNTNYYEIEDFVLKSYQILKRKKETDKQLYYQIHIVYIIANTLFRNRKFKHSLDYLDEMEQLMSVNYYKDFALKHGLIKALNLNYNNNAKEAIATVEQLVHKKSTDTEAFLDLQLTLSVFYFQQEDFTKAKLILSKFYHTDQWYINKTSTDWIIKKNITELLLYIELHEDNLFYSRLKSFRRQYSKYLKDIKQIKILNLIKVAEQIYLKPELVNNAAFKHKIENSPEFQNNPKEDIFIISIYAWLKSKLYKTSLYTTTLQLIANVK